jgi:hypothetical protein
MNIRRPLASSHAPANELAYDLRFAVRAWRRSPGLGAMIVLLLARGVGANAAVYGVADPLFWRAPAGVERPAATKTCARR